MRELLQGLTGWQWAAIYAAGVLLAVVWMRRGWRWWAATITAAVAALLTALLLGDLAFAAILAWLAGELWLAYAAATPQPVRAGQERTRAIKGLLRQRGRRAFSSQLDRMPAELDRWLARVRSLARTVEQIEGSVLIERDRQEVPARIAEWQDRLQDEDDPHTALRIEQTLGQLARQQAALAALKGTVRRGRLLIDETLAAMGEAHAHLVQILSVPKIDGPRVEAVSAEIDEQIRRLADLLAAIQAASHEVEHLRQAQVRAEPPSEEQDAEGRSVAATHVEHDGR